MIGDLNALLERGAAAFPGFRSFASGGSVGIYVEPAVLPPLAKLAGAQLRAVRVKGFLPVKGEPSAAFAAVLERGASIMTSGSLTLGVAFAEASSRPSKRYPDHVGVQITGGEASFSYRAGRSQVFEDVAYRREFMRRVTAETGLPIELTEVGNHFSLRHRTGGRLSLTDAGPGGTNPSAFKVVLETSSASAWLDLISDFLGRFAGPKRFESSWLATTVFDGRAPEQMLEGPEIYGAIVEAGFPAERYFIDATLLLERLDGLDALRVLCGPKDELYTDLAAFPLPEDNYLNLQVVTTSGGHRIGGESRLPVDVAGINAQLGLDLMAVS